MKILLNFASDNISRDNLKNFFKLTLDLKDDVKKVKKSSKPVFLIPIIDRSGSMSSAASPTFNRPVFINNSNSLMASSYTYSNCSSYSKLDCAKNATCELVDLLENEDKFALISFDDSITVNQKPISLTSKNRNEIKSNINRIHTGGCTNISDALKTAFDLFSKEDTKKYNCKIVLLSDGCANVGFSDEKEFIPLMTEICNKGISTSTIGLGTDYDLGIMETISGNCAGSFNHISDALAIKDIFTTELRTAQSILCTNTVVKIKLPDMVAFKPNLNNYNEDIKKDCIQINLGNLYSSKDIYYEFSVLDEKAENVTIAVEVEYDTTDSGKTKVAVEKTLNVVDTKEELIENKETIDEIMSIVQDRYVYEASKAISNCDYASATISLANSKSTYDSITTAYNCCSAASSDVLDTLSETITSSSADQLRSNFSTTSKKMRNS